MGPRKVAVIGAGISGLSAALSLAASGAEVVVYHVVDAADDQLAPLRTGTDRRSVGHASRIPAMDEAGVKSGRRARGCHRRTGWGTKPLPLRRIGG